ncbi:MAG: hypothetical protein WAZ19_15595 [Anaerolineae bacterium]
MMAVDTPFTWPAPFWPNEPIADALWPSERVAWSPALAEYVLQQHSQPGDLVTDPFAQQSSLVRAAARQRRRLVLNNTSPATVLGVLTSAAPPAPAVFDHAFGRVADAPRRGRTLAHHLDALYQTICPECAQTIAADSFLWDRASGEPIEKRYRCPHCGSRGPAPADMEDVATLTALEVRGAAYWGLLSRLVKPGDPLTGAARTLQDLYSPRALLVISELLTAADQRITEADELRAARAMILHVLMRGLSGVERRRGHEPGTLQLPRRFVEHNLWQAFEHAYRTLRQRSSEQPLRLAADLTRLRGAEGEGRVLPLSLPVAELAERLPPGSVALLVTEPPPFEPASYALNFLWTGWLFGREAANSQRATLSMEQWSWDWYARAMTTALRAVRTPLRLDGRLVLAFSDQSVRRALALLSAASAAGWRLVAQATQTPTLPPADRLHWRFELALDELPLPGDAEPALAERLRASAQTAVEQLLAERGEPAPLALVQTACAVRWDELGLLAELRQIGEGVRRPVATLVEQLNLALSTAMPPAGLVFLPAAPEDAALGGWWATEQPTTHPPLADRVEALIARQLERGTTPVADLMQTIYTALPGWQTPDAELITACLASYADVEAGQASLRAEDQAERRQDDQAQTVALLAALGQRLGYTVHCAPALTAGNDWNAAWEPANLVWCGQDEVALAFAVTTAATIAPWLATPPDALAGAVRCVVLPGGRAGLLDFKLRRSPTWRTRLAWTGWEFVKFRHVRELAAETDLTPAAFRARLGLDPVITLPGQQLSLFDRPTEGARHDAEPATALAAGVFAHTA